MNNLPANILPHLAGIIVYPANRTQRLHRICSGISMKSKFKQNANVRRATCLYVAIPWQLGSSDLEQRSFSNSYWLQAEQV